MTSYGGSIGMECTINAETAEEELVPKFAFMCGDVRKILRRDIILDVYRYQEIK